MTHCTVLRSCRVRVSPGLSTAHRIRSCNTGISASKNSLDAGIDLTAITGCKRPCTVYQPQHYQAQVLHRYCAGRMRGSCLKVHAAAAVQERPATYKVVGDRQEVPAYKGKAVELKKGQFIKVINTPGTQVVDFFAMNLDTAKDGYLREIMSMHHTRAHISKLIPVPGDVMVTSTRRPILTIIEDTGPGVHDTLIAACDHQLYELELGIGPDDPHDSCTNNLHTSLRKIGWKLTDDPELFLSPAPLNLWMNAPFATDVDKGVFSPKEFEPPAEGQTPGDYVLMRAEMNCVCVMSACPSDDICGINGAKGTQSVHFEVLESI